MDLDTILYGSTDTIATPDLPPGPLARGSSVVDYIKALGEFDDSRMRDYISTTSQEPELDFDRWETAKAYARNLNIPARQVFNNLDQYDGEFFGKTPDYKTAPKAILDVGLAAANSMRVGRLYSELNGWSIGAMAADLINAEQFGYQKRNPDEIKAEISNLKDQIEKQQTDILPRNAATTVAKWVAGSVPYTYSMVAHGVAVGTAVTLTAGALTPVAGAALLSAKTTIMTGLGWARGASIMAGMDYDAMISNGTPEEIAKLFAPVGGIVKSAVEQVIGVESMVGGALSSKVVAGITSRLGPKVVLSGAHMVAAQSVGKKYLVGMIGEALEEGGQAAFDMIEQLAIQAIVEEGTIKDPMTIQKGARGIRDSMLQTLVTYPFLGIVGHISMARETTKTLQSLAATASSMNKDDFIKVGITSGVLGESAAEGQQTETFGKIWDTQIDLQMRREANSRQRSATYTKALAAEGTQATDAPVVRTNEGLLNLTAVNSEVNPDGSQAVTFLAGDGQDGRQQYGEVNILVNNDSVVITGGLVESKYVGISSEIISSIAAQYPGKEVILGAELDEPALEGGYTKFLAVAGKNPFTAEMDRDTIKADLILDQKFSDANIEPENAKVAKAFLRNIASSTEGSTGKSYLQMVQEYNVQSDELGLAKGGIVAGQFEMKNDPVTGAVRMADSFISIAKGLPRERQLNALLHETKHFFRAYMSTYAPTDASLKALEKSFGVENGKWTPAADEQFVSQLEEYMAGRFTPDAETASIFERIGEFLRAVYDAIKDSLTPETRAAFDGWFGREATEATDETGQISVTPGVEGTFTRMVHPDIKAAQTSENAEQTAIELASMRSGISVAEYERMRIELQPDADVYADALLSSGSKLNASKARTLATKSWTTNPQLVAEVKYAAGMDLTPEESALLEMGGAKIDALMLDDDGQIRYMVTQEKGGIDASTEKSGSPEQGSTVSKPRGDERGALGRDARAGNSQGDGRLRMDQQRRFNEAHGLDPDTSSVVASYNQPGGVVLELDPKHTAQIYYNTLDKIRSAHPFGIQVSLKSVEEYQGLRLLMSEDGTAVAAIDGQDMVSVSASKRADGTSVASDLIRTAIEQGARTADCYGSYLPMLYAKFGFQPVARLGWSDEVWAEYAEGEVAAGRFKASDIDPAVLFKGWGGKVDYYFVAYTGDTTPFSTIDKTMVEAVPLVESWDQGVEAQRNVLLDDESGILYAIIPGPVGSEAFKKWFGKSKVVDENGKPLVVYHGSMISGLKHFDASKANTGAGNRAAGFFFSSTYDMALQFANSIEGDDRVYSVYLSLQNPKYVSSLQALRDAEISAQSEGYDGIIASNISDGMTAGDVYVAFSPTQIKSVNNRGTWDSSDERILYSIIPEDDQPRVNPTIKRKYGFDAAKYDTFQAWLSALYDNPKDLTEADLKWHQEAYDWAHSDKAKNRKYEKPGDYTRNLAIGSNLTSLVSKIAGIIYSKRKFLNAETILQADRLESAILRSPELKKMVDQWNKDKTRPSKADTDALLSKVRKNEGLYKYLEAMASADQDLAFEAMTDLQSVPVLIKKELTGSQAISIEEQSLIAEALEGTDLQTKLSDGTVTIAEAKAYIGVAKGMFAMQEELKGLQSEHQELKSTENPSKADQRKIKSLEKKIEELKAQYEAKEAARKLAQQMQAMKDYIMRPPSARVAYIEASIIRGIQEALRSGRPVDAGTMKIFSSYAATGAAASSVVRSNIEAMIDYINEVAASGQEKMTLEQMQIIALKIKALTDSGMVELRNQKAEFGNEMKVNRDAMLRELKAGKYYLPPVMEGTKEDEKRQKAMKRRAMAFAADRPDAWIRKYMGKTAARILYDESVEVRTEKLKNYDRRIEPVVKFINDNDLMKSGKLTRKVILPGIWNSDIDGNFGTDMEVTGSELVGIRLLIGTRDQFNQMQREAFIYGNLFSPDEKDADGTINEDGEPEDKANRYMTDRYQGKLDKLLTFLEQEMTAEEEELAKTMLAVTDNDADWYRFARSMVFLTNDEPAKQKFYFPLYRVGGFEAGEDATMDRLKEMGFHTALENGMSISRVNMDPRRQKRVKYDALQVFFSSIARQEHFTEVGPYVKKLQGLFRHSEFSQTLTGNIKSSLGQEAMDYINKQIDTLTNPSEFSEKASGAEALNFWRGSVVVSNLAWRWSSIVMQMLTSPLPGLAEAPLELAQVSMEAYLDPLHFYHKIENKKAADGTDLGAWLRHRQLTEETSILLRRKELGVSTFLEQMAIKGMSGLNWADRHSVAIVWESVFRKQVAKGMSEVDAGAYADRFITQTQPTAEEVDRAPMYRNPDTFKAMVLQFTQPLNVIWNNIRNDIPEAARDKEFGKVMGFITAYALSGLAMGAIAVMRGRGPDDDDDGKAHAMFWLHASTAQFTDSIPFIGQYVSGLTGYALTGDNNSWIRRGVDLAAFDLLVKGVEGVVSGARAGEIPWSKILINTSKGIGMMNMVPVRAIEEYAALIAGAYDKLND